MSNLIFTTTMRLRNNGKDKASWHFVTLPEDISKEILWAQQDLPKEHKRGWGSVKVEAHIGFVKRKTSVFPSKEVGAYILPIKKDIRDELKIREGDELSIILTLL